MSEWHKAVEGCSPLHGWGARGVLEAITTRSKETTIGGYTVMMSQ